MTPEQIDQIVRGIPYMDLIHGRKMTDFIHQHGICDVLELGFAHGVSTCYFAAAVQETGGSVVTMDLNAARIRVPNIEELVPACGLQDVVTWYFEPTSYLWRLMKFLQANPQPRFDFCYFDGGHAWDDTGFAFFLVDKLLRPGGWMIFDDIDWTFASSVKLRDTDRVRTMPKEERETPQVRRVFELLVMRHSGYCDFKIESNWGYARKIP